MFERRLKIFLLFLVLATGLLMMRAAYIQVVQQSKFKKEELKLQKTVQLTETTRGRILDYTGKHELAIDIPCTDACVDYRAIIDPPDPKWVRSIAIDRIKTRLAPEYRIGSDFHKASRAEMEDLRKAEINEVKADIENMWQTLAESYVPTDETETAIARLNPRPIVEDMRQQIIREVEMRRRLIWYKNFQQAQTKAEDAPRWQRWLAGDSSEGPDISTALPVSEETEPHVILRNIKPAVLNQLGKKLEEFPGLVLRASTHRSYPLNNVACHVIGRMSRVSAADITTAKSENLPEDRMYHPNDVVGREGIESLCEPLLRGSRGMIEKQVGDEANDRKKDFIPGQDVRITIDADLQADMQEFFKHITYKDESGNPLPPTEGISMHGAAVVIDVRTAEVRALVSNPDFNVNDLDARYGALLHDHLNNPLLDRATCDQFEPGSTVKPMVGLAGITEGLVGPLQGIECTGSLYLDVNGKKQRQLYGRCWVASEFTKELAEQQLKPIHHIIPFEDPHRGHDTNPDGWLTYSDALERSCNIFFETVADRLQPQLLAEWYDRFGFGRLTGIGITERKGLRPGQRPTDPVVGRMENCFAGIGQGTAWATPLQIANEAATIARGGIWMRPRLLTAQTQSQLDQINHPKSEQIDSVDLHLDAEGLRQAKIGMIEVVSKRAGSGSTVRRTDMNVAGKTGTAQAARLFQIVTDSTGKQSHVPITPVSEINPITPTEWYRSTDKKGKQIDHAWFMGFAPAENPQVAFCVLVEYGGSGGGGGVAGPIVSNILDACEKHGYLHPNSTLAPVAIAQ